MPVPPSDYRRDLEGTLGNLKETYCAVRCLSCAVLAPRPASPKLAVVQCSRPGPLAPSRRAFSGSQHAARKPASPLIYDQVLGGPDAPWMCECRVRQDAGSDRAPRALHSNRLATVSLRFPLEIVARKFFRVSLSIYPAAAIDPMAGRNALGETSSY